MVSRATTKTKKPKTTAIHRGVKKPVKKKAVKKVVRKPAMSSAADALIKATLQWYSSWNGKTPSERASGPYPNEAGSGRSRTLSEAVASYVRATEK